MKHYILLLIIPFAFFSCCFGLCEPSIHEEAIKTVAEYKPEEAGANILQIHMLYLFDEAIQFEKMCEYNGKFYFVGVAYNYNADYTTRSKEFKICIVDKATMTVENKLEINLDENISSEAEISSFEVFYNKAYLLFEWYDYSKHKDIQKILTFDFSDNTLAELDTVKTFGIDIDNIDYLTVNRVTNRLCLQDYNELHSFTYDDSNDTYIKNETIKIEKPKDVWIRYEKVNVYTDILSMNENIIFREGLSCSDKAGYRHYIYLSDITDVTKEEFIILNYLGYAIFYDALYDGEFVWVLVDYQLLKLKLL